MLPVNGNVNAMPRKISCKLKIGSNTITNVKLLTYASDWSGDITIGQVVSSYISATIPTPSFALTGSNVVHSMSLAGEAGNLFIGTLDKCNINSANKIVYEANRTWYLKIAPVLQGREYYTTDGKLYGFFADYPEVGSTTVGNRYNTEIGAFTAPITGYVAIRYPASVSNPILNEWTVIGQYQVDENSVRTRQGYTSFSAYDKLHNTVSTYHSSLIFPTTAQAVCNEVCGIIGITSTDLPINFTIAEDILSGYTLRDVLGFIAALCGKNAYLNADNQLELRWFTASGYTADGTRANVPYIGENNCTVNRLICQSQDGTLISGSGEGIYFTCPLMTQDWLDWLQGQISGFSYRKADVDIPYGNFGIQSGDIITVTTTGSSLTVPVMANSWTYDGGVSSNVSANGVSDYTGTANNAVRSATAQRVQSILDAKRAVSREQQQYIIVSGEIQHATELITGATGGYIKLEFGGNGKTAQLLVMDQPSMDEALNVWIFNQNGLGHIQRATTSDPFSQVNVALTREGTVVAERIAGQKISGVKIESTSEGTGSQPQVVVEDGNYTINRVNSGAVTNIGAITFKDRTSADGTNTIAIQVQSGNAVTIGTKGVPGVSNDNPEFIYYSVPDPPNGKEKFHLYGNLRLFGDLFFGSAATDSLNSLKSTVDSLSTAVSNLTSAINTINGQLADLDRRVTALENA